MKIHMTIYLKKDHPPEQGDTETSSKQRISESFSKDTKNAIFGWRDLRIANLLANDTRQRAGADVSRRQIIEATEPSSKKLPGNGRE